jgi:hypothetical protein
MRPLGSARPGLSHWFGWNLATFQSGCARAPDYWGGDSPNPMMACTVLLDTIYEGFPTRGSGELDHAVSIQRSPHALLTRFLDWTGRIQGLVDRSHDSDGQYRLYGTDQFTCQLEVVPRRWAFPRGSLCIIPPTHQRVEEILSLYCGGRQLLHGFFPPRVTSMMISKGNSGRARIMQSTSITRIDRT